MNKINTLLFALFAVSCTSTPSPEKIEQAKKEIVETEKQFAKMASEKGIAAAFYYYAADSAKINRGTHLTDGKEAIKKYYETWPYSNVKLLWEPDFVDVAASCDLGYTYGKYTFMANDSTRKPISSKGYFHTVWKKQKNGEWKFVWD